MSDALRYQVLRLATDLDESRKTHDEERRRIHEKVSGKISDIAENQKDEMLLILNALHAEKKISDFAQEWMEDVLEADSTMTDV